MFKMSFKLSSMLLLVFSLILTSCSNNRSDTPQNPNENNTSTHEHTFSNSYEYDDNYHWHSSTCGHDVQSGKGKHTFISSITEPTYESGGYTTYTCSTCGYSYIDDETDALTHHYSNEWTYDSSAHWHACTDEGYENLKKDEDSHTFTTSVTDPTYESGGYTTYTCSTCGYSYIDDEIDKLTHNYSNEWSYDSSTHWHACTDEGYEDFKKDEDSHTFTTSVTDPTYESGGYTTYTCTTCGYTCTGNKTEPLPITITWKNYDGTILEVDNNVTYGSMPSYDGTTPTKESDDSYNYYFSGWTPEVEKATENATYTATFASEEITYTIDFDLNGGLSDSYKGPLEVKSFSKDFFFFDCVKDDWSFRGWEYQNEKIFDENGNQLKNVTLVDNMVFKAIYTQTVKLTIVTNMAGAGTITGEGEYPYNTYVDVSAKPKQGYEFIGWYYQGTLLSNTEDYKYMMWDQDITLEARFQLDSFAMKIYSNSEDNGLVLLKSNLNNDYLLEYSEQRKYTSEVTIAAYSKTDVRFLGWYDENNQLVTTNAVYSFTMPNHDYTLEARWNYFKINYDLNGGINNVNNPDHFDIDDNEITLFNPTRNDKDFVGWKYNGELINKIDSSTINRGKEITLEAIWSNYTYNVLEDDNGDKYISITGWEEPGVEVTVPKSLNINGENIQVKEIGKNAFKDNKTLKSVILPDTITLIGDYAFSGCSSIKSIIIPDACTSIQGYAFSNCSSLVSIFIPDNVTTIKNYAFSNYSNFIIYCEASSKPYTWDSRWNSNNEKVIRNSYLGINGTFDDFKYTGHKDDYGNAYLRLISYVGEAENVSVPTSINVNGENIPVKEIGKNAFKDNKTLKSIILPETITSIGEYAFSGCSSITSITIPDACTSIQGYAFNGCSNLKSATIGENSKLTIIESYAFLDCSSLMSIFIPDSVSTIESYAFSGCSNLTIYCKAENSGNGWESSWDEASSSITAPSVMGCNGGGIFEDYRYTIYSDKDGQKYIEISKYLGNAVNLIIPETFNIDGNILPVKAIGDYAYENCDSLTKVIIPDSITTIGLSPFLNCGNLVIYCEASTMPKGWDSSFYSRQIVWDYLNAKITEEGLVYHVYENENDQKYISIDAYIGLAKKVVLPNTIDINGEDIPVTLIESYAFSRCDFLTSVIISDNVKTIESDAFSNCDSLTSVIISDSVKTIGQDAFSNCSSLAAAIIPNNVTTIEQSAFAHCSPNFRIYSETYSRPSGWWYSTSCIFVGGDIIIDGDFAYTIRGNGDEKYIEIVRYLGDSRAVNIPETINVDGEEITVTAIGEDAFTDFQFVDAVIIPDSVTIIDEYAFTNTSVNIYCESSSIPNDWEIDRLMLPVMVNGDIIIDGDFAYTIRGDGDKKYIEIVRYLGDSKEVNIPETINVNGEEIAVTAIGRFAFSDCYFLKSIFIPKNIVSIEGPVFIDCYSLIVYCEAVYQPADRDDDWNVSNVYTNPNKIVTVVWGYQI